MKLSEMGGVNMEGEWGDCCIHKRGVYLYYSVNDIIHILWNINHTLFNLQTYWCKFYLSNNH